MSLILLAFGAKLRLILRDGNGPLQRTSFHYYC